MTFLLILPSHACGKPEPQAWLDSRDDPAHQLLHYPGQWAWTAYMCGAKNKPDTQFVRTHHMRSHFLRSRWLSSIALVTSRMESKSSCSAEGWHSNALCRARPQVNEAMATASPAFLILSDKRASAYPQSLYSCLQTIIYNCMFTDDARSDMGTRQHICCACCQAANLLLRVLSDHMRTSRRCEHIILKAGHRWAVVKEAHVVHTSVTFGVISILGVPLQCISKANARTVATQRCTGDLCEIPNP
jgi:hypothetical protein